MKKLLLAAFATFTFGAGAQDLAVALDSPATGTTVGPGISFSFAMTITNAGSVDITTSDTVRITPLVNTGSGYSNLISVSSGGDTNVIRYSLTGVSIASNGGTNSQSISFGGVSIQSNPAQFDFCAQVSASGPNWGAGSETNVNNNIDCNTVDYDPGNVGIAEGVVFANVKQGLVDNSYYANGRYYVDVKNLDNGMGEISLMSITGQKIRSFNREVRGGQLEDEITFDGVRTGIYIVSVSVEGQTLSAKKIIVE